MKNLEKIQKKKKTILVLIIINVLLLALLVVCLLFFKKPTVVFKTDLRYPYNSEVTKQQLVENIDDGQLVGNYKLIDTLTLGKHQESITVSNKLGKRFTYSIEVEIYDDQPPVIAGVSDMVALKNKSFDFLENVNVSDNYDKDVVIEVSGNYDLSAIGQYEVIYSATDSSGNTTTQKANLVVKNKADDKIEFFTTSKGFNGYKLNGITYIEGIMIVNKTYTLPSSYNPGGLTTKTAQAFNKMKAAAKKDGINIFVFSGFRSYSHQKSIYSKWVNVQGVAKADWHSARPGHSEHQSGYAIDINCTDPEFVNTATYRWLQKNAYKYGFAMRYLDGKSSVTGYGFEPWHYRYVGEKWAEIFYNNGDWLTFEDYFGIDSIYDYTWK